VDNSRGFGFGRRVFWWCGRKEFLVGVGGGYTPWLTLEGELVCV